MFPLSRRKDLETDEKKAQADWVPGWNPHLDIWHCMSSIARNQERLARNQSRMMTVILWFMVAFLLNLGSLWWTILSRG